MAIVHWVTHDGQRFEEDVADGTNLMDAAVFAGVPDINGDCGGNLSCATCHVIVDDAWADKVPAPDSNECTMLDSALPTERQAHSRLSCQLLASADLDGMVLHVPKL